MVQEESIADEGAGVEAVGGSNHVVMDKAVEATAGSRGTNTETGARAGSCGETTAGAECCCPSLLLQSSHRP